MSAPPHQFFRWAPPTIFGVAFVGAYAGANIVDTMYKGMNIMALGFVVAAILSLVVAAAACLSWRSLSRIDRVCGVGPAVVIAAFASVVVASGAA